MAGSRLHFVDEPGSAVQELSMGRLRHGRYVEIEDTVRCVLCPEPIKPGTTAVQFKANYYHPECWASDWP